MKKNLLKLLILIALNVSLMPNVYSQADIQGNEILLVSDFAGEEIILQTSNYVFETRYGKVRVNLTKPNGSTMAELVLTPPLEGTVGKMSDQVASLMSSLTNALSSGKSNAVIEGVSAVLNNGVGKTEGAEGDVSLKVGIENIPNSGGQQNVTVEFKGGDTSIDANLSFTPNSKGDAYASGNANVNGASNSVNMSVSQLEGSFGVVGTIGGEQVNTVDSSRNESVKLESASITTQNKDGTSSTTNYKNNSNGTSSTTTIEKDANGNITSVKSESSNAPITSGEVGSAPNGDSPKGDSSGSEKPTVDSTTSGSLTDSNVDVDIVDNTIVTQKQTDFSDKDISGQDFSNKDLKGNLFVNTKAVGTNFKNSLMDNADLTSANLTSANLSNTTLTSAKLDNANLTSANLTNANLSNTTLAGANFNNASISGTNFGNTTVGGFTKEQFYSTSDYKNNLISGVTLSNNDVTGWDFSGKTVENSNFSNSQTMVENASVGMNFGGANVSNTSLEGALVRSQNDTGNTTAGDFTSSNLKNVNFDYSMFMAFADEKAIGVDFSGSNLENVSMRNTSLYSQSASSADSGSALSLYSADKKTTATNLDLSGAFVTSIGVGNLAGLDMRNSNLTNVNLDNANITVQNEADTSLLPMADEYKISSAYGVRLNDSAITGADGKSAISAKNMIVNVSNKTADYHTKAYGIDAKNASIGVSSDFSGGNYTITATSTNDSFATASAFDAQNATFANNIKFDNITTTVDASGFSAISTGINLANSTFGEGTSFDGSSLGASATGSFSATATGIDVSNSSFGNNVNFNFLKGEVAANGVDIATAYGVNAQDTSFNDNVSLKPVPYDSTTTNQEIIKVAATGDVATAYGVNIQNAIFGNAITINPRTRVLANGTSSGTAYGINAYGATFNNRAVLSNVGTPSAYGENVVAIGIDARNATFKNGATISSYTGSCGINYTNNATIYGVNVENSTFFGSATFYFYSLAGYAYSKSNAYITILSADNAVFNGDFRFNSFVSVTARLEQKEFYAPYSIASARQLSANNTEIKGENINISINSVISWPADKPEEKTNSLRDITAYNCVLISYNDDTTTLVEAIADATRIEMKNSTLAGNAYFNVTKGPDTSTTADVWARNFATIKTTSQASASAVALWANVDDSSFKNVSFTQGESSLPIKVEALNVATFNTPNNSHTTIAGYISAKDITVSNNMRVSGNFDVKAQGRILNETSKLTAYGVDVSNSNISSLNVSGVDMNIQAVNNYSTSPTTTTTPTTTAYGVNASGATFNNVDFSNSKFTVSSNEASLGANAYGIDARNAKLGVGANFSNSQYDVSAAGKSATVNALNFSPDSITSGAKFNDSTYSATAIATSGNAFAFGIHTLQSLGDNADFSNAKFFINSESKGQHAIASGVAIGGGASDYVTGKNMNFSNTTFDVSTKLTSTDSSKASYSEANGFIFNNSKVSSIVVDSISFNGATFKITAEDNSSRGNFLGSGISFIQMSDDNQNYYAPTLLNADFSNIHYDVNVISNSESTQLRARGISFFGATFGDDTKFNNSEYIITSSGEVSSNSSTYGVYADSTTFGDNANFSDSIYNITAQQGAAYGINISDATFGVGADFSGSSFDVVSSTTRAYGIHAYNAIFSNANFQNVNMKIMKNGVDVTATNALYLQGTTLNGADFRGSNISNSNIDTASSLTNIIHADGKFKNFTVNDTTSLTLRAHKPLEGKSSISAKIYDDNAVIAGQFKMLAGAQLEVLNGKSLILADGGEISIDINPNANVPMPILLIDNASFVLGDGIINIVLTEIISDFFQFKLMGWDNSCDTITLASLEKDINIFLYLQNELFTGDWDFSIGSNSLDVFIDAVVPEPAEYAMLFGFMALAFVLIYRRRK